MKTNKNNLLIAFISFFFIHNTYSQPYFSREEIPEKYKWDLTEIYPDWEAWAKDYNKAQYQIKEIQKYRGTSAKSADNLLNLLQANDSLITLISKVCNFVFMNNVIEPGKNNINKRLQQEELLYAQAKIAVAWINPEIYNIPRDIVLDWMEQNPDLQIYRLRFEKNYYSNEHQLDEEQEKLLYSFYKVLGAPAQIYASLSASDIGSRKTRLSDGLEYIITPTTYKQITSNNPNQKDRKLAFEALCESAYLNQHIYASVYKAILQSDWTVAKARNYNSILEFLLSRDNVPKEIYNNLVNTVRKNTKPFQRYFHLRKKVLGLEKYYGFDSNFTLVNFAQDYTYDEAKQIIISSVGVLGDQYQKVLQECSKSGRVDVYEYPGKRQGEIIWRNYGKPSYILLNYNGTFKYLFTLAHEFGHLMHIAYSSKQPRPTFRTPNLTAETVAIFNQRLFIDYALKNAKSTKEKIAILDNSINEIINYFFFQTMYADFELQVSKLVEKDKPVNADVLSLIWNELLVHYMGNTLEMTKYDNYLWTRIHHFYDAPFYMYQYGLSYAAALHIHENIFNSTEEKQKTKNNQYINLLKSGGDDYPTNQLKRIGVDLTTKESIIVVIKKFDELVNQLEEEISKLNN